MRDNKEYTIDEISDMLNDRIIGKVSQSTGLGREVISKIKNKVDLDKVNRSTHKLLNYYFNER